MSKTKSVMRRTGSLMLLLALIVTATQESPYVKFADHQRSCPVILSEVYNSDLDGFSSEHGEDGYNSGVWVSDMMVDAFIQEMQEKLEPLGISLSFVENNWDSFYNSAKSIKKGGFYSFLIFLAVLPPFPPPGLQESFWWSGCFLP